MPGEPEKTISQQYTEAIGAAENFQRVQDREENAKNYNNVLEQLKDLDRKVEDLSLFSSNESLEDVSTENLKYLGIKYDLAKFMEQFGGFTHYSGDKRERLANLMGVNNLYMRFLHIMRDYDVLEKRQADILSQLKDSYHPSLSELEPKDPVARRSSKIENYKREKQYREAVKVLEDPEALEKLDEEVVRTIFVDQLKYDSLKSFQSLEDNLMEIEILKNMLKVQQVSDDEEEEAAAERARADGRQNQKQAGLFDKGYTDKVESTETEKPFLGPQGKVLRPFTVVPNRESVQQNVMGTGQVLPTMTVEEFVDQELQNGGIAKSAPQEEEADEDDYEAQDKETYHQREFDEFKDYHAKGSGNMKGNLG